jgi:hypothetical protein
LAESVIADQRAISSSVRQQPSQDPVTALMRHTDVQGDGTAETSARTGVKGTDDSDMRRVPRAAIVASRFARERLRKT